MSRSYVFPPSSIPALPIEGSEEYFPIHRVWCVAKNYAAHAREMGAEPTKQPPRFFSKPPDAVYAPGGSVPYPPATQQLDYEGEMFLALGAGGAQLSEQEALDLVFGFGVGLDLTRRDLQRQAKAGGEPWDLSKGFDYSGPCSPIVFGAPPAAGLLTLHHNDQLVQRADVSEMIWGPAQLLARLSAAVTLAPGDVIFTGTPAGVGPVSPGDQLRVALADRVFLDVKIGARGA